MISEEETLIFVSETEKNLVCLFHHLHLKHSMSSDFSNAV